MRCGYADPPYPGCAHLYRSQADYAGEVDHAALVARLLAEFDGFMLHTSSVELDYVLGLFPGRLKDLGCRVMPWVKPFAAFKRNVSVAYAWEPMIVRPVRKPVVSKRVVMRDWFSESITLRKGLTGVKPKRLCRWAFEVLGLQPSDELVDLYPGSGAVTRAWQEWQAEVSG